MGLYGLIVAVAGVATAPPRVGRQPPQPQPRPPGGDPVPLAQAAPSVSRPAARVPALSGEDLLQSPNVFRGVSSSGTVLEHPGALEREEELEVCMHSTRPALHETPETNPIESPNSPPLSF